MTSYQQFQELHINFSAIGMEPDNTGGTYFCTPEGAKTIGWAGEDGIHSCFVPGFGELVFTVNPESASGQFVHPVARNFEDFLRLLLACKDVKLIESLYQFDEEGFACWMQQYEATQEQLASLNTLQEAFSISPMEHPVTYIKQLQQDFDYSRIPYAPVYYEETSEPEEEPDQWKVTYDGNFWCAGGQAGREVRVNKTFTWGKETWRIPSVYVCGRGLVVDFCVEKAPEDIKTFIDKWDLQHEAQNHYTRLQQEQMDAENPLRMEVYTHMVVNGRGLKECRGCGVTWIPSSCFAGDDDQTVEKQVLEYYGLDESRCWVIRRKSFSWQTAPITDIASLSVRLERGDRMLQRLRFEVHEAGEQIPFTNPVTGAEHTLTVHAYEKQDFDFQGQPEDGCVYPNQYAQLTYSVHPDLSEEDFWICDCREGDQPQPVDPDKSNAGSAVIGIIGGMDGPVSIYLDDTQKAKCHTAYSALRFEPVDQVHWYMQFREKSMDHTSVPII